MSRQAIRWGALLAAAGLGLMVIAASGCAPSFAVYEEPPGLRPVHEMVAMGQAIPAERQADADRFIETDGNPDSLGWAWFAFSRPTIGVKALYPSGWRFIPYDRCNARQRALCDAFLRGGK